MSTQLRLFAALFASALAIPVTSGAAETLTMKFREGETYGYLIEQEMTVSGKIQGQDVTSEVGQKLNISTHIKSVDAQGSAKAEQTIERVRMKMAVSAPVEQTIEYDTDSDTESDNPAVKQIAGNISNMLGEAIGMTISPTGEMTDIVIPDKIKATQQGAGGANSLEETFKKSGLRLPEGEITKGKTWTQEMDMGLPFGTMHITTNYTYDGKNEDGLEKISAKMVLDLTPAENADVAVTATAKRAEGSFLFDNTSGRLVKSEIYQDLDIDIGGVAKQNTKTVVKMTLIDDAQGDDASK